MDEQVEVSGSGPLSWRDVYTAVRDSETRLTKVITDAVAPLVASDADHEHRLRSLEEGVRGAPLANSQAIATLQAEVAILKDKNEADVARGQGRRQVFDWTNKTLAVLIAICTTVLTIAISVSTLINAMHSSI